MKKKYFVRYIPVDGEIKVGDKIQSESINKGAVTVTEIDDTHYWTDEQDIADPIGMSFFGVRKDRAVKVGGNLCLCSHDIQSGDKVFNRYGKDTGVVARFKDDSTKLFFLEGDEPTLRNTHAVANWGKVIGEVSSNALEYVRQGQEFDENDVVLYWQIGESAPYNYLKFDDYSHFEKMREEHPTVKKAFNKIARIKGPCGHFH